MAKKQAAAQKTVCEEGGEEILAFEIPIATTDVVKFTTFVCKANARVRAWLEEIPLGQPKLLVDESGKSEVAANLPKLPAGRFMLRWSVITPSDNWQTRTELAVGTTVQFRRRKTADGSNPVNMGLVVLEVK